VKTAVTTSAVKRAAARYKKIVEWSDEDKCFIGLCPGLFYGGCHGKIEAGVRAQLQTIVEEWVTTLISDGKPLPAGTANRKINGKVQ
jgi:predicted RNase H-like HicB family nuclease